MTKRSNYVTVSYFDEKIAQLNKRFDDLFKKLDWFAGKYTKVEKLEKRHQLSIQ